MICHCGHCQAVMSCGWSSPPSPSPFFLFLFLPIGLFSLVQFLIDPCIFEVEPTQQCGDGDRLEANENERETVAPPQSKGDRCDGNGFTELLVEIGSDGDHTGHRLPRAEDDEAYFGVVGIWVSVILMFCSINDFWSELRDPTFAPGPNLSTSSTSVFSHIWPESR